MIGKICKAHAGAKGGEHSRNDQQRASTIHKECVERNIPIPVGQAEERLIQLVKDHGKWVDAV